ncbi:hypothetical protein [Mycolicibacterium sp. HK-90]|uniref:hypothetical protein n=1 Tax=Mycolicibacterium sp. HK-90 TaxID=3056937 RepID=UPI002658BB21|nr:hypothetical protein [Mycolicibacterium sp. HK-90]WKG03651.1 hypothetical protein QU592_00410 [Mycolicibacterium sp. HK-90]
MDGRDRIEALVALAARENSGGPRVELFRALNGKELYYATTEVLVDGRPMMSTPLRRLDDGSAAMVVYTSKRHPDLPRRFAGAQWSTLLGIAQSVRSDWMVIVGSNNETVAITRDQLAVISASLQEPRTDYAASNSPPPDALENAISNAVNTNAHDRYESALNQLRDRELYAHLTDEVSPGGQPSLLTSAAGGVDGWILTYTTRMRPGIKYGGIVWEELVRMVKNNTSIPGIRVVNEADDWIVLGRDVI